MIIVKASVSGKSENSKLKSTIALFSLTGTLSGGACGKDEVTVSR